MIIEKRLKFTGEGLNKPSNEDFKSSNPINKIKNDMIKPDIYSNLPWPKGCSISGFLQESLKPKIETKEAAASEILLNASAIIATELARIPKINFKPNSTTFKKIPNTNKTLFEFLLEKDYDIEIAYCIRFILINATQQKYTNKSIALFDKNDQLIEEVVFDNDKLIWRNFAPNSKIAKILECIIEELKNWQYYK